MMISDLLRYRDDLMRQLANLQSGSALHNDINCLQFLSDLHKDNFAYNKVLQIKNNLSQMLESYHDQISTLNLILKEIDRMVDEQAHEKYNITNIEFSSLYSARYFNQDETVIEAVKTCIYKNSDHNFPALQLGCNTLSKVFSKELVAFDPLYLHDYSLANIDYICKEFNDTYQKRLRKYKWKGHTLDKLPAGQFGFIFSWMVFNYANFATVQHYLQIVLPLLRPGGRFIFSYNNCDILENCALAEIQGMSYISKKKLIAACQSLGYEIIDSYDVSNNDDQVKFVNWLELKRPGELKSIRRRQVLGIIHRK